MNNQIFDAISWLPELPEDIINELDDPNWKGVGRVYNWKNNKKTNSNN